MEIKLTTEESEKYFHNALCNGLGYMCSGYDLELYYNNDEYKLSKNKLLESGSDACLEDVWLQMLKDGYILTIVDKGQDEFSEITLSKVHERVQKTPIRHLMDMINEQDDAVTADVILQTVIYNEVIFG